MKTKKPRGRKSCPAATKPPPRGQGITGRAMRDLMSFPFPYTHTAVIRSSGRLVPAERLGRLLIIYAPPSPGGWRHGWPVHTCRYDGRFQLLPQSLREAWRDGYGGY